MTVIGLGIEIECVANINKLEEMEVDVGDYRDGSNFCAEFKAERDSSINDSTGELGDCDTGGVEFISNVVKSKTKFIGLVDVLKKKAFGNLRLADSLVFDNSCGMHVHFSIPGGIGNKLMYSKYAEARAKFFELLDACPTIPDNTKAQIKGQYTRHYSKQFNEDQWKDHTQHDKYWEFNFISEKYNKGLEWRSLNAKGIRTWDEFKALMEVIYNSIEWLVGEVKTPTFKKSVVISKRKIDSILGK